MRDSLGRRRTPGQERGLRPLFPKLPAGLVSRSLRLAMSETAWRLLAQRASAAGQATAPRAAGVVIEQLLVAADRGGRSEDWQQWQIDKERQLLRHPAA